ncbi:hypothetical protein [Gillisia sp. Hel_I_29]|nr:hypothetical protein [Gillisia sp. Hel_I_29]
MIGFLDLKQFFKLSYSKIKSGMTKNIKNINLTELTDPTQLPICKNW